MEACIPVPILWGNGNAVGLGAFLGPFHPLTSEEGRGMAFVLVLPAHAQPQALRLGPSKADWSQELGGGSVCGGDPRKPLEDTGIETKKEGKPVRGSQ